MARQEDASSERGHRQPNLLIHEKSPYLLQHAFNPVHWYPWSEVAFSKARQEHKPIFLSIGYATCHWCHVMERESFENEEIANLLNQHFVPIKVDREERPDVDQLYMTFVQVMTGSGGWPMSVWLTPELKPFFAGTYFPPEDRWGRIGFKTILERIAQVWRDQRDRLISAADDALARLQDIVITTATPIASDKSAAAEVAAKTWRSAYDPPYGGFGSAPKFPQPPVLDFLLRHAIRTNDQALLDLVFQTLRAMARGGLFDQLGGGFHRYSVDERWHVPHFEKMLYDQAQLACLYLDAFQLSRDLFFADITRRTLDFVLRDMTAPDGGFFSALDADSPMPGHPEKMAEGAFYVWTWEEVQHLLGDRAALAARHYGIEPSGNVREDPYGVFAHQNVLYCKQSPEEIANLSQRSPEAVRADLEDIRKMLYEARARRPAPATDDKVLTSWNGLMISAFARAAQVLEENPYLAAAERAALFIQTHLYDPAANRLQRRYRDGDTAVPALAEDYAFLIRGLIDLYETAFDEAILQWAVALQERMDADFSDEDGGYFDAATGDISLLLRLKSLHDGVLPCACSAAAANLLRLATLADRAEWIERADALWRFAGETLQKSPYNITAMLAAMDYFPDSLCRVVISGVRDAADTKKFIRAAHCHYLPGKVVLFAENGRVSRPEANFVNLPECSGQRAEGAFAYICVNQTCRPPVTSPDDLDRQLADVRGQAR